MLTAFCPGPRPPACTSGRLASNWSKLVMPCAFSCSLPIASSVKGTFCIFSERRVAVTTMSPIDVPVLS